MRVHRYWLIVRCTRNRPETNPGRSVGETGPVEIRTVGVEEELMLVDPVSGTPASAGDSVHEAAVALLGAGADHLAEREFKMEQTEIG